MTEIIHKLCAALKSSGFPLILFLMTHASTRITEDMDKDDSVPGDNFPQINV